MIKLIYKFNRWLDSVGKIQRILILLFIFAPFIALGPYIGETFFKKGSFEYFAGMAVWILFILFLCISRMIGRPRSPNRKDDSV